MRSQSRTVINSLWLASAIALLLFSQLAGASDVAVKQRYNTQGSIGNITLGMKLSALKAQDSSRLRPVTGVLGEVKTSYQYTFPGGHAVIIGIGLDGVISEIRITDPYFLTEKGIHVGDVFSKVRAAYPDYVCNHGNGYLVLVNYEINRAFEFGTDGLSNQWLDSQSHDCSMANTQKLIYIGISTPR